MELQAAEISANRPEVVGTVVDSVADLEAEVVSAVVGGDSGEVARQEAGNSIFGPPTCFNNFHL